MKLTPLLVKKQEFSKSFRGFNIEEVQQFLEKLSNEIEDLINDNEILKAELENLNRQVTDYQRKEKTLQEAILKAEETSSKSLESARMQTELLVREAELKASQLVENAREDAVQLRGAVITLREEKDMIISKLKAIVSSQSYLLEGKLKEAGEEPQKPKQSETKEKVNIDVDDIVNKIL